MFYSQHAPLTDLSEALQHVKSIPVPEKTDTYTPVPHDDLIGKVFNHAENLFKDVKPSIKVSTAKNGNQLFGVLNYDVQELVDKGYQQESEVFDYSAQRMTIGFRNSYDKSLAVGIVLGANVVVCDNLQFSGKIRTVRKHTSEIYRDLEGLIEDSISEIWPTYYTIMENMERLKRISISSTKASWLLGEISWKEKILSPTQSSEAWRDWNRNIHGYNSAYKLFQACTHALKKGHPANVADQHLKLDSWFDKHLVNSLTMDRPPVFPEA